jgi:hypothetical protein
MRGFASTFIALLLGVFTFNQVILPHLLSLKDRTVLCDPLEKTAEEACSAPEFKLKESPVTTLLVLFAPLHAAHELRLADACRLSKGRPPHGNSVPIYLDERVLRI